MKTIADAVVTNAKPTLLNWDHEVNPTPVHDFLENVKEEVHYFAGWSHLSATFDNGVLQVKCGMDSHTCLYTMIYDAKSRREIYGRVAAIGLGNLLDQIHAMVRH